jgi:hypothetical protein
VDTSLSTGKLKTQAFISKEVKLGEKIVGSRFLKLHLQYLTYTSEKIARNNFFNFYS